RQTYCFFGDFLGDSADLKNDTPRLDNCDIMIDCAFTATHAGFGWLGGDRLIREDANPHFTTALHKAGERDTRGLNLARLQPAWLQGLQPILSEGEGVTTRGGSPHATAMLFAVF